MTTASDPLRILRDIDGEDIPGMAAKGFSKGPVISGEEINGFVEAARDEERAGFFGGEFVFRGGEAVGT